MRWVVILVAASLVGLLTYGVVSNGTNNNLDGKIAKGENPTAPDATLPTLGTNQPAALKSFRGKVVLVNFWASWCPGCTQELADIQKVQDQMANAGATVVGINSRDASHDAEDWVRKNHLTYPSLRDGSGDFADRWGVHAMPESYLLDKQGHIIAAIHGQITPKWVADNVTPALTKN